jgi:TonB family protein
MASDHASTGPLGVGAFDMSPSARRLAASSGAPAPPSAGAFDRLARPNEASYRKGGGQILATASFNAGIEQNRAIEHPAVPEPRITPVEILAKPRPVYTAEARALGLEGQVTLAVLFAAAGQVRVLRVERGLGHGLDEAAIRAAEKISFRAAQMDGRPIDYPAKVQIVFQLAF